MAKSKVKNQAAVTLGKMGGKKGGPARAKALPPSKRTAIAKQGAKARWAGSKVKDYKRGRGAGK